jgi:hypothetical protein
LTVQPLTPPKFLGKSGANWRSMMPCCSSVSSSFRNAGPALPPCSPRDALYEDTYSSMRTHIGGVCGRVYSSMRTHSYEDTDILD